MGKIGIILWASAISMAGLVGCGSSKSSSASGPAGAPDFAALKATLTTPTGTLQPGSEGTVAGGFSKQSTASTDGSPFGGSSASPKSLQGQLALESLHTLSGPSSCPGLDQGGTGTCACPGGGSLDYNVPVGGFGSLSGKNKSGPVDITLGLTANSCVDESGGSFNGKFFVNAKSTKADNSDLVLVESIHLAITGGKKPGQYDVDLLLDLSTSPQRIVFAVDVPDGKVLVSGSWDAATKTGTITITDKTGTTTCTAMNGMGSCKGVDGKLRDGLKF